MKDRATKETMRGWKKRHRARKKHSFSFLSLLSSFFRINLTCSIFVSPRLSVELIQDRSSLRPTK